MSRRSRAREVALQLLYRDDLNRESLYRDDQQFLSGRLHGDASLVAFAENILCGVRDHQTQIDDLLRQTADNWRLERMAATDRNVLRIGAFEMLFGNTPAAVAIDEAIELAKRYGDRNSPKFVNGVLDRLRKICESNQSTN